MNQQLLPTRLDATFGGARSVVKSRGPSGVEAGRASNSAGKACGEPCPAFVRPLSKKGPTRAQS